MFGCLRDNDIRLFRNSGTHFGNRLYQSKRPEFERPILQLRSISSVQLRKVQKGHLRRVEANS